MLERGILKSGFYNWAGFTVTNVGWGVCFCGKSTNLHSLVQNTYHTLNEYNHLGLQTESSLMFYVLFFSTIVVFLFQQIKNNFI